MICLVDILIGNGCIWEEISPMNACLVSQSVFYQVLNAVVITNVGVVSRKRGDNISFKKETEKIVITSERLDTNYCQVQD